MHKPPACQARRLEASPALEYKPHDRVDAQIAIVAERCPHQNHDEGKQVRKAPNCLRPEALAEDDRKRPLVRQADRKGNVETLPVLRLEILLLLMSLLRIH